MQGNKLLPGGKNVLPCGPDLHAPDRLGRDRAANPLKYLRKSARFEIGAPFLGLFFDVGRMVMVASKRRDNGGAALVGRGVWKFQGRYLVQMVVQEPRGIDQ